MRGDGAGQAEAEGEAGRDASCCFRRGLVAGLVTERRSLELQRDLGLGEARAGRTRAAAELAGHLAHLGFARQVVHLLLHLPDLLELHHHAWVEARRAERENARLGRMRQLLQLHDDRAAELADVDGGWVDRIGALAFIGALLGGAAVALGVAGFYAAQPKTTTPTVAQGPLVPGFDLPRLQGGSVKLSGKMEPSMVRRELPSASSRAELANSTAPSLRTTATSVASRSKD